LDSRPRFAVVCLVINVWGTPHSCLQKSPDLEELRTHGFDVGGPRSAIISGVRVSRCCCEPGGVHENKLRDSEIWISGLHHSSSQLIYGSACPGISTGPGYLSHPWKCYGGH